MGRPVKTGLDYFPLDTSWDIKIKLLKAKFHLIGIGCMMELFKDIYHEGYAIKWDEDTKLLFADDNSIDIQTLDEIVNFALSKGIFSRPIFDKTGYLTSHGIQSRWKKACVDSKRSTVEIDHDLDLLSKTPEETPSKTVSNEFPPEETRLTPEETTNIPEFSTQSKVKKVKESSGREIEFPPEENTTTAFIQETVKRETGYLIDEKIASSFATLNLPEDWLEPTLSFYAFAKEVVDTKYPGKTPSELRTLFITAIPKWENLRVEYPSWKAKKIKERQAASAKEAKFKVPEKCDCGGIINRDKTGNLVCASCSSPWVFDEIVKKYTKLEYEPVGHFDLGAIRKKAGERSNKPIAAEQNEADAPAFVGYPEDF